MKAAELFQSPGELDDRVAPYPSPLLLPSRFAGGSDSFRTLIMKQVTHLKCLICGREYRPDRVDYVCPEHGRDGILDVTYDYDRIAACIDPPKLAQSHDYSMWRYKPLLPVDLDSPVPSLAVGWTPMYRVEEAACRLGLRHLWVKDEGRQPTASLKDRASAVAVVKATERGIGTLTTASTGNAAAALAGLCASVQKANVIFVPESAPSAKIAQLLVFGSRVLLVKGSYDDAFDLCLEAADEFGWYNRSTGYNPFMTEGKKTAAFEICEQLGWRAPDVILVSVGDGCIIGGLHKGLRDLRSLGWIEHMPRLIGVQAEGSAFLARAWENDEDVLSKQPIVPQTIADSISTGLPRDRIKAMAAVKETGGAFIRVDDENILAAVPALARAAGVFGEPAGAAAWAGLIQAVEKNLVDSKDRIVVLNTGNGLKDIAAALKSVEIVRTRAQAIKPSMESLRLAIGPK